MSRDPFMFSKPELIQLFKERCRRELNLLVIITSVDRTKDEQLALFTQGRHSLDEVNAQRKHAGYPPITEQKNKIVTWTLDSKHIPDEVTGKCEAFDFAVIRDSKMIWDVKADTNESGTSDYLECGVVAESLGLRWGGRFRNPDNCHVETV